MVDSKQGVKVCELVIGIRVELGTLSLILAVVERN